MRFEKPTEISAEKSRNEEHERSVA